MMQKTGGIALAREIQYLLSLGLSFSEIRRRLKLSLYTIEKLKKKHNFQTKTQKRIATLHYHLDIIISDYQNGKSIYRLSKEYNLHHFTIRRRLVERGIKIRQYNKQNLICSSPLCNNLTEKGGRRFCKSCRDRKYLNSLCSNCTTPLYREKRQTLLGEILILICKNCKSEFDAILE